MAEPRGRGRPAAIAQGPRQSPALAPPGPTPWLALALILVGTIVLYLPALRTGFFADDYLFLDQVRGRSLIESLRVPDPLSNFFRPISRQLYFWIVAGLTHESPVAFRIGNLITLLGVIALLFALVRRLAGDRAAVFAAAFLGLHYTADVPVRWACGSQELLAVGWAIGAILLHVSGHRRWAGVAMLLAALSKEVVLLAPLVAIVADHRPKEGWVATARRGWPLALAVVVWGLIFLAMPQRRAAQATEVEFDLVKSPLAAFAHLLQVIPGLEWLPGRFDAVPHAWPPIVPLAAAVAALFWVWRSRGPAAKPVARDPATGHAVRTGLLWVAVATAPVIVVALLWSAYYYLFAVCGVALILGALLARAPVAAATAVLIAVGWGSANARNLHEFGMGRDPWTPVSHINASYIERSNRITATYLASLERAYPRLPPGSTVYFGGLMSNVAFQRGDGPLLRWAYRDPSLKAYYLTAFSKQTARPGPLLFFLGSGDTLRQLERGPDLFLRVAFAMIVSDRLDGAGDALEIAGQRQPQDLRVPYWRAWICYASGDTAEAAQLLKRAGYTTASDPAGIREEALARLAVGDTLGAVSVARRGVREHAFDAAVHGLTADLLLIGRSHDPEPAIEAFAARAIAPTDPYVWRRWAMVQMDLQRPLEALASFREYFRLGGAAAQSDTEARQLAESIRASIPRGVIDPEQMPEGLPQ